MMAGTYRHSAHLIIIAPLLISVVSASPSPVFHGDVFRNALFSPIRLGVRSASRHLPVNTVGIGSRQRWRNRSPSSSSRSRFAYKKCPVRTGSQSLHIFGGLGLPIVDDIFEPIEAAWEFYNARDEIQEQMLSNAGKILKKNSVRFLGFTGGAVVAAEVLARLGFIGLKGQGIKSEMEKYVACNEKLKTRLQRMDDAIDEQLPGIIARTCRSCFKRYRALPDRLKFTIAFSTGAMIQQSLINAAVSAIKLGVGSFVVLETLAFTGIIGEPGESIVEYIDDHDDEIRQRIGKKWGKKAAEFRLGCRKYLSFDGVVELYEAAVDEEKVATFGLGLGMFAGSIT